MNDYLIKNLNIQIFSRHFEQELDGPQLLVNINPSEVTHIDFGDDDLYISNEHWVINIPKLEALYFGTRLGNITPYGRSLAARSHS